MSTLIARVTILKPGIAGPARALPRWTLPSSRRQLSTSQRLFSAEQHYITTPIFYVNAAPHIGHLYTLILADVLKRWQVLRSNRTLLCTGTDEHGMKIQQAAAKAGMEPGAFCDQNYRNFQDLADTANVSYDHFVRTTEPEHRFTVQHFWLMLKQRGFIYPSKHEGWYSVSDETFYPESSVHLTLDPSTGRKFMASMETGKEVEWTSEQNYHFRLSEFRDRLLDFYKRNPEFIVPSVRMAAVVKDVENGLQDLSISRPVERLSWGIPVPDDSSQTIYVWLDALINYVTKANYPFQKPGEEGAAGWPADVQVIGKDIVRFHCIYWPAFLMALDIEPPRQVLTHAHWTLGRQKMSKSLGNVVNPFSTLDRFGIDPYRYYMIHDGGIKDDAAYDNSYVVERYRKGLSGGLGNLASRLLRGRRWDVQVAVEAAQADQPLLQNTAVDNHISLLRDLQSVVSQDFERLDPGAALKNIMHVVYETNSFIHSMEPWNMFRHGSKGDGNTVIYICAESLRICGILLQPFMPTTMNRLLDMLLVSKEKRTFEYATVGKDFGYGPPRPPAKDINARVDEKELLFPSLRCED